MAANDSVMQEMVFIQVSDRNKMIIPVTNALSEQEASTGKWVKTRIRSTMKNDLLNGLLHISVNGPISHSNKAKVVVTRAVEKYDSSQ